MSNYEDVILITGRNIDEFANNGEIYSYYLGEEYERGIVVYESVVLPISLLLKEHNS